MTSNISVHVDTPILGNIECRLQLHTEGGPIADIVARLLQEAEKSPRLMALVSLQLSKLIANNPALAKQYREEYFKMLLYGPPMNDNSFPGTALEVGFKVHSQFCVFSVRLLSSCQC